MVMEVGHILLIHCSVSVSRGSLLGKCVSVLGWSIEERNVLTKQNRLKISVSCHLLLEGCYERNI